MGVLFACIFMHHMHLVATEDRRRCPIPWNWSYKQSRVAIWVLGIDPRSYTRAANAFNHWDTLKGRVFWTHLTDE